MEYFYVALFVAGGGFRRADVADTLRGGRSERPGIMQYFHVGLLQAAGSDGQTWLIHFVEGEVNDLELRKLPALLSDYNVSTTSSLQ